MRRNLCIWFALPALLLIGCSGENSGLNADIGPDVVVEVDAGADVTVRPSIPFTVATFNVGRFFDTVCDSNNCGDQEDFERQLSDAEFGFKADQIASAIEEIDPDGIVLQELESQACVDALAERLPDYDVRAFGEIGGTATLDVAILARGATLLQTRRHRDAEQLMLSTGTSRRFAREFLEVHVDFQGERVVLFSSHFKAKRNDNPAWRLAEAEKAREIVDATAEEFPEALVVMGGDLNDEPGSEPLIALTGNGGLELVTRDVPSDEQWTFSFFNDRLFIDHLLLPTSDSAAYVEDSARVVRDASGSLGGSDHAAVVATFDIFTD